MHVGEIEAGLFAGLTEDQKNAVSFPQRRLLVVAGAGSGKTEVMARRIAWWVGDADGGALLEYQPERGLVRYLDAEGDDQGELNVPLDEASIRDATALVSQTARKIRDRAFKLGPPLQKGGTPRCPKCDFFGLCGMKEAAAHNAASARRL
jgi:hypothetical protein